MVTQMDPIGEEIAKLSPKEQQILEADRERWQERISQASHLKEWLSFGPGLLIRQRLAMRMSNSNRPTGRRYSEQMHLICKQTGLNTLVLKSDREQEKLAPQITAILWLYALPQANEPEGRLDRLNRILADTAPSKRALLNLPTSARFKVLESFAAEREAELEARRAEQGLPPLLEPEKGPTLKDTNMALQEELKQAEDRIAALSARVATLEHEVKQGRGSDVDFAKDSLADIEAQANLHLPVSSVRKLMQMLGRGANARERKRKEVGKLPDDAPKRAFSRKGEVKT